MTLLAPTLQLFFTERMANQRQASPATITSYRNTFRLLLRFMQDPRHPRVPRPGVDNVRGPCRPG